MITMTEAEKHLKFHLNSKRNLQKVPALVGLTGVGKTAIVKKVAKELDKELIYFNMAQLSEGEMALPVPVNGEKGEVQYVINHKLKEVFDNPDKEYIVLVDEFTRATVPVISEWMTIINERQIQGAKFGDNVRFVAAMNPTSSMRGFNQSEYVATEMDDAHSNRFTFIHVETNVYDWLDWAEKEGAIHPLILSFLNVPSNRKHFYGKEENGIRMRTPRSWEFLSDSLKDMEEQNLLDNSDFLYQIVSDQVGEDIGVVFEKFAREFLSSITYEDVVSSKAISNLKLKEFDKNTDTMKQTLLEGIVLQMATLRPKLTKTHVQNFLKLWETIKANDLKYALSTKMAQDLFDTREGLTNEERLYYILKFQCSNCKESKDFQKFIHEQHALAGIKATL